MKRESSVPKKKLSTKKYLQKNTAPTVAQEPALAYLTTSLDSNFMANRLSIAYAANQGITANAFFDAADYTGYHREDIAALLDTSLKTLMRYKQENKKLSPLSSELVLKLIVLFKKGRELFGVTTSFKSWLEKPSYAFDGKLPYDLLKTSVGIDLLMEELTRIEFGDLA